MKKLPLSKGKFTTVSEEDYERANQFKWTYMEPGYAYRNDYSGGSRKRVYLHRFLLNVTDKHIVVDHINGDKLNNTRPNLRACTHSENIRNSKKPSDNTSGYKGVSWDKNRSKWLGYTSCDGKFIHLGRFLCKHAAARAHNEASLKSHGEFARINDIERCECSECVKYPR